MAETIIQEPTIKTENNAAREAATLIPISNRGVEVQNFAQQVDYAKWMAAAGFAVSKDLRGNVGACLAVMDMSQRWGFSTYQVARLCYSVNGVMAFESQLIHAIIEKFAPLQQRLRCTYEGDGDQRVCVVTGLIRNEADPLVYRSPPVGKISPKNSPLWKSDVDQQLWHYSSRAWCRRYCPDILMGIYGRDEIVDNPHIGAENAKDITTGVALHERLKNATKSGEGFSDDVVTNGLADGKPQTVTEKPQAEQAASAPAEPAGEPVASEAPGHGGEASGAPRKPGGRPKGSKNKPKGEGDLSDAEKEARAHALADARSREEASTSVHTSGRSSTTVHTDEQSAHPEERRTETITEAELAAAEAVDRMTEEELLEGLKPLTAEADAAAALPKTSAEYEPYAMAYIQAATSADELDKRWRGEKTLRTDCMVVSDVFQRCFDAYKAKSVALKGS